MTRVVGTARVISAALIVFPGNTKKTTIAKEKLIIETLSTNFVQSIPTKLMTHFV